MPTKICAFTGHRPTQIPGGERESSPAFWALYAAIKASVRQAAYTVRYARHRGVPVRNVLALPEAGI